jgi:hypothetical protein
VSKEHYLEDGYYVGILEKEVERLNKDNGDITKLFAKEREETKRLNSIIKEVREWAKKYSCQFTNDDGELVVSEISFNIQARPCDLFKILDKVERANNDKHIRN